MAVFLGALLNGEAKKKKYDDVTFMTPLTVLSVQ